MIVLFYKSEFVISINIMGSIDINQYRSRIGSFTGKKLNFNTSKASFGTKLKTKTAFESIIILSYLLVLSTVTQKLLIISGVELNPGPSHVGKKYNIDT